MDDEIWKNVVGMEGRYQVSSKGRVRSVAYSIVMRPMIQKGYVVIWLWSTSKIKKKWRVHQLVAQAFHPNPESKEFVNHKDKDRTHNCIENLEWCTHEENMRHRDAVPDIPF